MTALDLMHRFRSGEIDHNEFVQHSEKLPLEELQSLTPLLIEWAAEPKKQATET